ncbi:hypothetical protein [Natrinema sp. HArc-T2]|uniref:hypothetical protein n=1 Tax=Natrinema sp. HArc-T2 TaxID=3242701 RepID=UPI00359DB883
MAALRAALFEWGRERIASVVIARVAVALRVAVSLAHRVTDEVLAGVGATVRFAIALITSRAIIDRLIHRSSDSSIVTTETGCCHWYRHTPVWRVTSAPAMTDAPLKRQHPENDDLPS